MTGSPEFVESQHLAEFWRAHDEMTKLEAERAESEARALALENQWTCLFDYRHALSRILGYVPERRSGPLN